MESQYGRYILRKLLNYGIEYQYAYRLKVLIIIVLIFIIAFIAYFLTKKIVIRIIAFIIKKTENPYDDIFLEEKVFKRLAHVIPAIILYQSIDLAFPGDPIKLRFISHAVDIYLTWMIVLTCTAFLSGFDRVYHSLRVSIEIPIKGYLQIIKIICYIIGVSIIISIIFDVSPFKLLSGLGAMAAVILLILKDTILGFIASIQLTGYNMIKIGDWITMPSQNANGKVVEISINTVRVQNFDLSISMIPTYNMVSQSFVNWSKLDESGGRRIKRSLFIDIKTVRFCTFEMLEKYKTLSLISEYISAVLEKTEIREKTESMTLIDAVNENSLTNLTVLRYYMIKFLEKNPFIKQDFDCLVRQLQPTAKGIPLEVYAFCTELEFSEYEAIQSDIFDHLLAMMPFFDLKIHQDLTV